MKTRSLVLVAIMLLGTMAVFAQDKTEKIKVYGECGMCETRIEKAVNDLDGVSSADWNKETKMLEVKFNSAKTDVHKVHMAVTKVGHDTDMHKAKDKVYENLPACCKYERPSFDEKLKENKKN